jgi:BlaI family penicillinase repressor
MELKISDAEWEVMEIIWQRKEATAAEVIAELAGVNRWNHRTVRTLLARLVEKGALSAQSDGNRYVYRALISRMQCVRHVSRSFLEKVFGGDVSSLLAHFVRDSRVTAEDIVELRKLLDTQRGKK